MSELAKDLGVSTQSLRNWVLQADLDEGRRDDGLTNDERAELTRLRRENRVLREEREILKSRSLLRQGSPLELVSAFEFIQAGEGQPPDHHDVSTMGWLHGPLAGEVDLNVTMRLEPVLLDIATATSGSSAVFDCAKLSFIDCAGINMLLQVAARSGKQVKLTNLNPGCRRVFEILGLCEMFGINGERSAFGDGFD